MAALVFSALPEPDSDSAQPEVHKAGEAISADMVPVYQDSNGRMMIASCAALASSKVYGIAISTSAAADDRIWVIRLGDYTTATTLTQGVTYYLGTSGAIVPFADLTTGQYIVPLFIARDSGTLAMKIDNKTLIQAP